MKAEQFAYWLKGFIELENPKELTEQQLTIVKDHLDLVFKKVTPNYDGQKVVLPETNTDWEFCKGRKYIPRTTELLC